MKRSIISLLTLLVLVLTLVSSVTITAMGAVGGGDVLVDNNKVSDSDDGYYYVNGAFEYEKRSEATGYFYVELANVADFDGKTTTELYALAGKVEGTNASVEIDPNVDNAVKYYVFADILSNGQYSNIVVVCYDTIAPTIDNDLLNAWMLDEANEHEFYKDWIPAQENYTMPSQWATDKTIVVEASAVKDDANELDMLNVSVEYRMPNDYYDQEEWDVVDIQDEFDTDTTGQWVFRFVVEDMAGNKATSADFFRLVRLVDEPTITLTSKHLSAKADGIIAGSAYTIPVPSAEDAMGDSISVEYVVQKLVDGEYVEIYDSKTSETLAGYEEYVKQGVLYPDNDELSDKDGDKVTYIYKILYTATDDNGTSIEETLEIQTIAPTVTSGNAGMTTLQWVLIAVAVLSGIGIICLLFIKPKQSVNTQEK